MLPGSSAALPKNGSIERIGGGAVTTTGRADEQTTNGSLSGRRAAALAVAEKSSRSRMGVGTLRQRRPPDRRSKRHRVLPRMVKSWQISA
jgi:hypothetical protein